MKLVFSRHILEKYSNIIFLQNPSSGSRVIPCGRTDRQEDRHTHARTHRHDEADSCFLQFCARANSHLHSVDNDGASRSLSRLLPFYFTSVNKSRVYRRCYIQTATDMLLGGGSSSSS